eukprot:358729-Chlamydomonas_euryale.AAC.3
MHACAVMLLPAAEQPHPHHLCDSRLNGRLRPRLLLALSLLACPVPSRVPPSLMLVLRRLADPRATRPRRMGRRPGIALLSATSSTEPALDHGCRSRPRCGNTGARTQPACNIWRKLAGCGMR